MPVTSGVLTSRHANFVSLTPSCPFQMPKSQATHGSSSNASIYSAYSDIKVSGMSEELLEVFFSLTRDCIRLDESKPTGEFVEIYVEINMRG